MKALESDISTGDLAELFGVTARWIQRLTKEGVLSQSRRGQYDLVAAVKAYVKFLQEKAAGDAAHVDQKDMKARKLKAETEEREAKARRQEIALAVEQKRLLQRDDVVREWTARCIEVKAALLELPRRVGFRFSDPDTRNFVEEEVENLVFEVLKRYARRGLSAAAYVDDGRDGGDAPSGGDDDQPVGR